LSSPNLIYCIYFLQAENLKSKPEFQQRGLQDGPLKIKGFLFTCIELVTNLLGENGFALGWYFPIGLQPKLFLHTLHKFLALLRRLAILPNRGMGISETYSLGAGPLGNL